jgi:hypothetical protein
VATYEVRDGDQDSSPLLMAVSAPANTAVGIVIPEQALTQVRVVKVGGTGSSGTVFYV